jgi:hypothetical protein
MDVAKVSVISRSGRPYRPCYRMCDYLGLDRPITRADFSETLAIPRRLAIARRYALNRLDLIRFDMSATASTGRGRDRTYQPA